MYGEQFGEYAYWCKGVKGQGISLGFPLCGAAGKYAIQMLYTSQSLKTL